ncbi:MAG: RpiB/LacA/LacB family sugar-phosphate isomerase [bacterium]|nr:RpiB/LacA/LacB family sugar-phosphate isomerase [bacterium]
MTIYLGADHRGFKLKEHIKKFLLGKGYQAVDLGASQYAETDDYPDYAQAVARKVAEDTEAGRGILICGSGVGVDIVANKFRGVHSAVAISPDQVYAGRHDDGANVLSLAADFIDEEEALKMVQIFLVTPFGTEPRYKRRLDKIIEIENFRE